MKSFEKARLALTKECRDKLLSIKSDILNRIRYMQLSFAERDSRGGDEVDQAVSQLAENEYLLVQKRLHEQLIEIDFALERILRGTFGVCEETEEYIEAARLRAIPWTTLSIEGAELRESRIHKYAK